jgi:hypothetical protein
VTSNAVSRVSFGSECRGDARVRDGVSLSGDGGSVRGDQWNGEYLSVFSPHDKVVCARLSTLRGGVDTTWVVSTVEEVPSSDHDVALCGITSLSASLR